MGRFNLASSEKSFSFYMSICDDNGILSVNGAKAQIHFSGDESEAWNESAVYENLSDIYDKCFCYANTIWSTTDYKAQCLAFAKLYSENLEELDDQIVAQRKITIQKEIEKLQKQLSENTVLPNISDTHNWLVCQEINKLKKWLATDIEKLADTIEGSDTHKGLAQKIESRQAKIAALESSMISTL